MGIAVKSQSARTTHSSRHAPPGRGKMRENDITERFDKLSDSILLTEPEVGQVVGHPVNTLKYWRLHGKDRGPPSVQMPSASIRYRVGDVRKWLADLPR
jgi:predicted DNA-binding transcriptional regulator AlpA